MKSVRGYSEDKFQEIVKRFDQKTAVASTSLSATGKQLQQQKLRFVGSNVNGNKTADDDKSKSVLKPALSSKSSANTTTDSRTAAALVAAGVGRSQSRSIGAGLPNSSESQSGFVAASSPQQQHFGSSNPFTKSARREEDQTQQQSKKCKSSGGVQAEAGSGVGRHNNAKASNNTSEAYKRQTQRIFMKENLVSSHTYLAADSSSSSDLRINYSRPTLPHNFGASKPSFDCSVFNIDRRILRQLGQSLSDCSSK